MTPIRAVSTVVSTRFSFLASSQLIPIHSTRLAKLSRIVVSITEASSGRAHLGGARCTTDRHQAADPCEVAVAGSRPRRMGARLGDPRDIHEGGRRTVSRQTGIATHALFVEEVPR